MTAPGIDAIGVVRRSWPSDAPWVERLSAREHQRYDRISHRERRARWLAGRLLAKHLFLGLLDDPRPGAPVEVRAVGSADLRRYPAWLVRSAEILADRPDQPGWARVHWQGRPSSIHLSVSHGAEVTAACLRWGGAIGIDVEAVRDRSAAFYTGNFTPVERRWAAAWADRAPHAYTLLWCLKESAMKLRQSEDLSLWELPRIEVRLASPTGASAGLLTYAPALGERVSRADAEIVDSGEPFRAQIAVTATRHTVLACVMRGRRTVEGELT